MDSDHHQPTSYLSSLLLSICTLSAKLEVNDTQLWGVFVYNDHSVFSNLSLLFIDSFKIMGRKIASDIAIYCKLPNIEAEIRNGEDGNQGQDLSEDLRQYIDI